ncbi:MFS transporter [Acetanaerobacterium elongatum]|uniref:MFS-type transporter involved in bile tolerance, Atg22 family n=1 Tax=Acetanaerobacterium elongatum TaxID=258515 RepID=A0A1H0GLD2_9FIRM|nr:MFS transporter [Acetanaerobacterium elongatum]SDO07569.1 MFS-type transporter involved in bile tolerance, Atg22 family [Acetanaerobacterium elongatum]
MLNIVLLGLTSFFSDISSEMVYPLIPLYLTSVLGATPALVGIIEGIAESLASLLKVFSGYITDKKNNKKPVAFCGYATGLVYKLALLLATSWAGILVARVIDRLGKGIRTAPRDVLVSESADKNTMGRAFGIHKALDMAGSAAGILIAYLLLANSAGAFDYKKLFIISIVPAIIGLAVLLFVKEKKQHEAKEREQFWKRMKELDGNLKLYLLVAFIFTLGNSSNTFLLLRAKDVGFNDTNVVLLYFLYNITAALLSVPFGRLSDRIGRKRVLVAGYLVFAAVYAGFAFVSNSAVLVGIFILYGFYTAMTAGVERALIAEIAPPRLKGTMLGLHATIVGIALLPASVIAGFLWNLLGASAPFLLGASLSLIAAVILMLLLNRRPSAGSAD